MGHAFLYRYSSAPELSSKPLTSTTPTAGKTYTNGISELTAEQLSAVAHAISDNSKITKTTSEVYLEFRDGTNIKASVGDGINWTVDGTSYRFNIIGFNHDDLTDGNAYGAATATGKSGITFQMHRLYSPTIAMNDSTTNSGGYGATKMHKTHLPKLLATMPPELQSAIKAVNKKSGIGNGSTTLATVECDLFILATIEIFGTNTYSAAGEGTQYAYYAAGNPRKKVGNADGEPHHWNTRSPTISASTNIGFCEVNGDGNAYVVAANTARYQAIALCL